MSSGYLSQNVYQVLSCEMNFFHEMTSKIGKALLILVVLILQGVVLVSSVSMNTVKPLYKDHHLVMGLWSLTAGDQLILSGHQHRFD